MKNCIFKNWNNHINWTPRICKLLLDLMGNLNRAVDSLSFSEFILKTIHTSQKMWAEALTLKVRLLQHYLAVFQPYSSITEHLWYGHRYTKPSPGWNTIAVKISFLISSVLNFFPYCTNFSCSPRCRQKILGSQRVHYSPEMFGDISTNDYTYAGLSQHHKK